MRTFPGFSIMANYLCQSNVRLPARLVEQAFCETSLADTQMQVSSLGLFGYIIAFVGFAVMILCMSMPT